MDIPYKNHRFNNELEARWAVFLDAVGIGWQHKQYTQDLSYFWLLEQRLWLGVRPSDISRQQRFEACSLYTDTRMRVALLEQIPPSTKTDRGTGFDLYWSNEYRKDEPVDVQWVCTHSTAWTICSQCHTPDVYPAHVMPTNCLHCSANIVYDDTNDDVLLRTFAAAHNALF